MARLGRRPLADPGTCATHGLAAMWASLLAYSGCPQHYDHVVTGIADRQATQPGRDGLSDGPTLGTALHRTTESAPRGSCPPAARAVVAV